MDPLSGGSYGEVIIKGRRNTGRSTLKIDVRKNCRTRCAPH